MNESERDKALRDTVLEDVAGGIRKAVETLQKKRRVKTKDQPSPLPPDVQSHLDQFLLIKTYTNRDFEETKENFDKYCREVRQCLKTNGGKILPLDDPWLT